MAIQNVLNDIKNSPQLSKNFTAFRYIAESKGEYKDFPQWISRDLVKVLNQQNISKIYSHQYESLELIHQGENIIIVTPTASGKTLCYNLPVLNSILKEPESRALYLFPTKALSQDQITELQSLIDALEKNIACYTYDGDTPTDARRAIRLQGHIIATNPDMLHTAMLPHHDKWIKMLQNLKYVVIDELHTYRGVFGSHLNNVIRRLKRICRFYGSSPLFICSSATIANPAELAHRLIEENVELIDKNGAPRSEKYFIFYNPPVVNRQLGIRANYLHAARSLALDFINENVQTILFTTSRQNVEVLTKYLKDKFEKEIRSKGKIAGYRGGYLPNLRREIERGLRNGEIVGVISTNALELGIDIGQLDACIIVGYPGSIASTWQQAGRAGRRKGLSVAILVARSNPLDQFIIQNPDYFFGKSPEQALINPDNLTILLAHIKCAAFELPFTDGERFGSHNIDEILKFLEEKGVLHHSGNRWHWMQDSYPADDISLRSISADNFVVIDKTLGKEVIAEVDYTSAFSTLYPEAIYMHQSQQYQVENLDLQGKRAYIKKVDAEYYTEALDYTGVKILDVFDASPEGKVSLEHGEVQVNYKIAGYKKIKFYTNENIGYGSVNLPEQEMHTTAYWFTLPQEILNRLHYTQAEIIDGLLGISFQLQSMATVLLMCDINDIERCIGDKSSRWFARNSPDGRGIYSYDLQRKEDSPAMYQPFQPTLFLYDNYPGGIGFSQQLFEAHTILLKKALEMIEKCPCEHGCPSCVGPVNEVGAASKEIAIKILKTII